MFVAYFKSLKTCVPCAFSITKLSLQVSVIEIVTAYVSFMQYVQTGAFNNQLYSSKNSIASQKRNKQKRKKNSNGY